MMSERQVEKALYLLYNGKLVSEICNIFSMTRRELDQFRDGELACDNGTRDIFIKELRDKAKAMLDLAEEISGT